jgi:hypothetical protein
VHKNMKRFFLVLAVLVLIAGLTSAQQSQLIPVGNVGGTLPASQGGVASVTTAGNGFFVGYWLTAQRLDSTSTGIAVAGNNQVHCFQFVLPYTTTVRNIGWIVNTTSGGGKADYGIYSAAGARLLHITGGVSTTNVSDNISASDSAVMLAPGVYFFAWTADNTTYKIWGPSDTLMNGQFNNQAGVFGTAANAATGGVLPATLGTVTNDGNRIPPIVVFTP